MFKFSLILFLQLMFSLVVFAQQTDRDINEENISFYTEKYDACSSIEEMEADHIKPWSKNGRTESDNCQLLCLEDNRRKGNK